MEIILRAECPQREMKYKVNNQIVYSEHIEYSEKGWVQSIIFELQRR